MNTQKRIVLSTTWNNLLGRDGVIGSNVLQRRALQLHLPNAYFIRVKVLKVKRNATALQTFFNSLKQSAYRVLKKRYVYNLQLAELPFMAFCASTLAAHKGEQGSAGRLTAHTPLHAAEGTTRISLAMAAVIRVFATSFHPARGWSPHSCEVRTEQPFSASIMVLRPRMPGVEVGGQLVVGISLATSCHSPQGRGYKPARNRNRGRN